MKRTAYVINGGMEGRNRLRLLADVFGTSTQDLSSRVGIPEGASCLDIGCGGGDVTRDLAQRVGPTGTVLGVDYDALVLDAARQERVDAGLTNVSDNLTTEEEFTATLNELTAFADDTSTLMGGPRTFQAWGRNLVD